MACKDTCTNVSFFICFHNLITSILYRHAYLICQITENSFTVLEYHICEIKHIQKILRINLLQYWNIICKIKHIENTMIRNGSLVIQSWSRTQCPKRISCWQRQISPVHVTVRSLWRHPLTSSVWLTAHTNDLDLLLPADLSRDGFMVGHLAFVVTSLSKALVINYLSLEIRVRDLK